MALASSSASRFACFSARAVFSNSIPASAIAIVLSSPCFIACFNNCSPKSTRLPSPKIAPAPACNRKCSSICCRNQFVSAVPNPNCSRILCPVLMVSTPPRMILLISKLLRMLPPTSAATSATPARVSLATVVAVSTEPAQLRKSSPVALVNSDKTSFTLSTWILCLSKCVNTSSISLPVASAHLRIISSMDFPDSRQAILVSSRFSRKRSNDASWSASRLALSARILSVSAIILRIFSSRIRLVSSAASRSA